MSPARIDFEAKRLADTPGSSAIEKLVVNCSDRINLTQSANSPALALSSRPDPPIWVMGLSGATVANCGGTALPGTYCWRKRNVPSHVIAGISVAASFPVFGRSPSARCSKVRFGRRWYASVYAIVAAVPLRSMSICFWVRVGTSAKPQPTNGSTMSTPAFAKSEPFRVTTARP